MREKATVVVGTDLSKPAELAMREAARWARLWSGQLVVVLVAPNSLRGNPLFPAWEAHVEAQLSAVKEQAREEVLRQLGDVVGEVPVEVVLAHGEPATELVEAAKSRAADLLVVGSHGYTGLKRVLLGSVAEKVVRRAECPVLVARPSEPGPVLVATDFSPASEPATREGLAIARRLGARPILGHVIDFGPMPGVAWSNAFPEPLAAGFGSSSYLPPAEVRDEARREAERRLKALLFEAGVDGDVATEEGPSGPTLATLAEKVGASLVVVGTAGRSGLARLALGSVAEAAVRNCPCSVLVVRGQ